MLNDVRFNKGQGGLGRPLPGSDYISGLVFYTNTLPDGFTTQNNIAQVLSIAQAEALGILADYSDETKAHAVYTITTAGAAGGTITFTVAEPFGKIVNLGTYTVKNTDTTVTLVAAGIVAMINAGTQQHGYTASNAAGVVTITARPGLGVFLNSGTPLVVTVVGTTVGAITAFTGGVASLLAIYHYHIAEYFRLQPQGNLFVGFFPVPEGSPTYIEINTLQVFAGGKIRQTGIYKDFSTLSASADVQAIQAVNAMMETNHMPQSCLLGADINGVALTALTALSGLNSNKVSVVISQDGAALGASLFYAYGHSITNLGALLGAVALAKVDQDIANPANFNISDGTENDVPAFATGDLFQTVFSTNQNLVTQLDTYRYIFTRLFVDTDGTFFNDSHCSTLISSDYAYIENNRTIDKAIRLLYPIYVQVLAGEIPLNDDGTIQQPVIDHLEDIGEAGLDPMVRNTELSNKAITIDPSQLILQTSTLVIAVQLLPVAIARNITVNIGYVLAITNNNG